MAREEGAVVTEKQRFLNISLQQEIMAIAATK
jgi:hypothetical protein